MKMILIIAVVIGLTAASIPLHADKISPSDNVSLGPSGLANQPDVFGEGKAQKDKTLGFRWKHSTPEYGYWGVGPDYGNYEWPHTGPYGERPRGRPMDALTYAPVPIEASRGTAKLLSKTSIRVSWPGGPEGVQSVDFALLGEAGEVMVAERDLQYPYTLDLPLPDPAQKVRITVNYTDGFSTATFWIPW